MNRKYRTPAVGRNSPAPPAHRTPPSQAWFLLDGYDGMPARQYSEDRFSRTWIAGVGGYYGQRQCQRCRCLRRGGV
jgi:hypothetical protein